MLGGILGVLFSVPLRRALVVGGGLPYPEGVAAAEVLKIGSTTAIGVEESRQGLRSEEHTSELQSLMRISYAVFCLKKKKQQIGSTHVQYNYNQEKQLGHHQLSNKLK